MLLADTWPFLSVSAPYHMCLSSDLLYVAKTDHTDKVFYTWLIKSILEAASKLRNTVQLTYLCRGHVWAGWSAPGPLQATPGDPLHPITAGERLVGQWWAAGFVTLAVTMCDLGVAWQASGSPRGLGGSSAWGSGREMSRRGRRSRQDAGGLQEKQGRCGALASDKAGQQPTEADVICWFGDSDAPEGLFIKISHGQMWLQQCGTQVEEMVVYRSQKRWLEMHSIAVFAAVLGLTEVEWKYEISSKN